MRLKPRLPAWLRAAAEAPLLLAEAYLSSVEALLESVAPDTRWVVIGSGISRSLRRYSVAAASALLAAAALGGLLGGLLGSPRGLLGAMLGGALGAVSLASLVLAVFVALPRLAYAGRGSRLEPRFPLFASSLATRLAAGMGLSEALLDMAERDQGDLPEFRVEFDYVASGLRAGLEPWRVLEDAARLTPSPSLRGLFAALAAASRTGAGLDRVVEAMLREYLFNVGSLIDRTVSGLGALLELFVAASVMLPIALGVVGLLLVFRSIPGLSFETLLFVTTFIATPAIAAAVIIIADSTVSRVRL